MKHFNRHQTNQSGSEIESVLRSKLQAKSKKFKAIITDLTYPMLEE